MSEMNEEAQSQSERALREALEKAIDQLAEIKTECEATADQFSGADMIRSTHYENGKARGIQVGIELIQSVLATPASREGCNTSQWIRGGDNRANYYFHHNGKPVFQINWFEGADKDGWMKKISQLSI